MGSPESPAPFAHIEQVSGTFSPALRPEKSKVIVFPALSPRNGPRGPGGTTPTSAWEEKTESRELGHSLEVILLGQKDL